jgi:hypothetical protein
MTVVSSTKSQLRGLQSLSQKWNITNLTFAHDGLHLYFDYQVADFINDNMVTFSIYDRDCKEGGYSVTNTVLLQAQKQILTNTYVAGGGVGQRMLALDIDLNPATITNDQNIYNEDKNPGAVTAQIELCVRFSLQTDTTPSIEVNFLETLVTLNVDLSDGFEIGEVSFAAKGNG